MYTVLLSSPKATLSLLSEGEVGGYPGLKEEKHPDEVTSCSCTDLHSEM